ncbi:MAG: hypothetical protein KF859_03330 [Phycisphaeraceae bacterium]|nr:hypothetical protein [Phycisphaeraceae bacterium]
MRFESLGRILLLRGRAHPIWLCFLVFLAAATSPGCSPRPLQAPEKLKGSNATHPLPAGAVYDPGLPAERLFEGGQAGRPATQERRRTVADPQRSDTWRIEIDRPDPQSPDGWRLSRSVHIARMDTGAIAMVGVDDIPENSATTFSPPLLLLPPCLGDDQQFTSTSKVEIRRISTGKVIDRGEAVSGASLRSPPDDSGATWTLWTTLDMKLSAARVEQRTAQNIIPGRGMVWERESLRVRIGPITIRSSDEVWTIVP